MELRRGGIPIPSELIHLTLEDIILENVHRRLTLGYDEKAAWNSFTTLSQVCHSFRSNTLHICERLLGEPTIEQVEGFWHEKSAIQHVCDVVEYLCHFSPYNVSCMPVEYLLSLMWAFTNAEYRAAVQLPGLFGLYDTWNMLRIIRLSTLQRDSIVERGPLEVAVLGDESGIIYKVITGFYFRKLKPHQRVASELVFESVKIFHGIVCWLIAGRFETMNELTESPLANPRVLNILTDSFETLERSERIAFGVQKNVVTKSKFRSLVGPMVSDSGLVSQLEIFIQDDRVGDPFNVKPKVKQYLADWLPFLQTHTNTLVEGPSHGDSLPNGEI